MAGSGNTQALSLLDRLYRFAGGLRSPSEVDIEAPVTVVHDISRGAELATSVVYVHEMTEITGGAGSPVYNNYGPLNLINNAPEAKNLGLTISNADVWLLDVQAFITNATKANLANVLAAVYPPLPAPTELYGSYVGYWNTLLDLTSETAATYRPLYSDSALPGFAFRTLMARLPMRVGSLRARFVDGGAAAAEYSLRWTVAVVPKGVDPPVR